MVALGSEKVLCKICCGIISQKSSDFLPYPFPWKLHVVLIASQSEPGIHVIPFNSDSDFNFLPPANEVWGKVIFLHLFVILLAEGVPGLGGGAWSWGVPGPGGCLVPRGVPGPGGGCLLRGCVPALGGAWSRGVPGGDPRRDGYCCRRYASYWNAFLFKILFNLLDK